MAFSFELSDALIKVGFGHLLFLGLINSSRPSSLPLFFKVPTTDMDSFSVVEPFESKFYFNYDMN